MKYQRVLLKLSGESLLGSNSSVIDPERLAHYAGEILSLKKRGVEVAVVLGGGNIFRGARGMGTGFNRVDGDYMGMLATIINSIALKTEITRLGEKASVLSGIAINPLCELMSQERALRLLGDGYVVMISGGTGNPFFTTDSAAALRALEIKADVLLKGTRVDGVYSADPEKDPEAVKYESLSFDEAISRELHVMDQTAFTLCRENRLPVIVFDINKKGSLLSILEGRNPGTIVMP